jgi:tryptophanyl-tRNA synthetase
VTGAPISEIAAGFEGKMYGHLKVEVAEAVCAMIEPLQARYHELRDDPGELERMMRLGAERARERASRTLAEVYEAVGFVPSQSP